MALKLSKTGKKLSIVEDAMREAMEMLVEPVISKSKTGNIDDDTALQEEEMKKCKDDFVYWAGRYFFTFDPRIEDETKREVTFQMWPKQIELHRWADRMAREKKVGLIQKSRDSGISVYFCARFTHKWLFERGFVGIMGSHVEDKLDKLGDMSTLMEKIRFAIRRLPKWMLPDGLNFDKHLMHRRIINPEHNNIISGEIGDQIGRGGRGTEVCCDEAAYLERPELVEASLSANTPRRFYVSTPNGLNNWFHNKSRTLPPDQVVSILWTDDPRKNEEWKRRVIEQDGILVFEREYNLNYAASVEGVTIPSAWVMAAVELPIPAEGDLVCGFDVAGEGDNFNCIAPRRGSVVLPLKKWKGVVPAESASIAARYAEELGAVSVQYDCLGPGEAIKAAWDLMAKDGEQDGAGLPFEAVPIIGGESPSNHVWADGKTSKQKFKNLRAEMWWKLRTRFQKTYEYVQWLNDQSKGQFHEFSELISIPRDDQLISELSTPLIQPITSGKIQIESKPAMRRRGIKSPDLADAVAYAFHDKPQGRKMWFV